MTRHKKTHTKPFKCNTCGKHFGTKEKLLDHERVHTEERPFKCGDCDTAFKQSAHLAVHQQSHRVEKPYRCTWRDKQFATRKKKKNLNELILGKDRLNAICAVKILKLQAPWLLISGASIGSAYAQGFIRKQWLKHHFIRCHKLH